MHLFTSILCHLQLRRDIYFYHAVHTLNYNIDGVFVVSWQQTDPAESITSLKFMLYVGLQEHLKLIM